MPNSKPRIFYLDFVRAVATVAIILTHYNALYIYNVATPAPEKAVITLNVAGIYIGDFGVSLFFIISGASLMYVYDQRFDPKTFYKKRFLGIYPLFWMAYFFAALYRYFKTHSFFPDVPKSHFVFTVLGIDSYVGNFGISSFCLVGEWFIAVILMMYCFFPLLRMGVKKSPVITCILACILGVLSTVLWGKSIEVFARIPEFLFGMVFQKYIKKVNWKIALLSIAILVLNGVLKPNILTNIMVFYVGICSFLLLVFLSTLIKLQSVRNICKEIGKYSYPCFLVHHFIIYEIAGDFDLDNISIAGSYMVFLITLALIMFFSWALQSFYASLKRIAHESNDYI